MPRLSNAVKAQSKPAEKHEYFILDETATQFGNSKVEVVNGKPSKTIRLTEVEAAFFIANGAISVEDPAAGRKAKEAADKAEAEAAAAQEPAGPSDAAVEVAQGAQTTGTAAGSQRKPSRP